METQTILRLELPSSVQVLETTDDLVGQLARSLRFDEDAQQDIQVAVHEALVNAIVHGNREDAARCVTLRLALVAGGLEITVGDEGNGFDPKSVPDPRDPANLSKPSGRGILFMRTLMDDVRFGRSPAGGTQVTMRKLLPRPARNGRSASRSGDSGTPPPAPPG